MGPVNGMGFTPMRFVASAGPGESTTNVSALAPITAIVEIFKVNNWKNLSTAKPKSTTANSLGLRILKRRSKEDSWLNEPNPLNLFFNADEKLRTSILGLNRARNTPLGKFLQHIRRVHRAQKHLLTTVYLLYSDIDEAKKISKDHRRHLPPGDQQELDATFSEGIFFAAQALTNGFRIRGIEYCTEDLIDPAKSLCAAMDALRFVFRTRALKSTSSPYTDLEPVLIDFDRAWTEFEIAICSSYFQLGPSASRRSRSHDLDMFTVLLSDTLIRAVEENLIDGDRVSCLDPEIMICLPRLALLGGLTHFSQLINLTDSEKCFWWLKPHADLLKQLQKKLHALPISHLHRIETMLAGGAPPICQDKIDDPKSSPAALDAIGIKESALAVKDQVQEVEIYNVTKLEPSWDLESLKEHQSIFTSLCRIADGLQTGSRAKHFLPLLQKVFMMHIEQRSAVVSSESVIVPGRNPSKRSPEIQKQPEVQVVVLVVENHHYHPSILANIEEDVLSSDQEDDTRTITSADSIAPSPPAISAD